MPASPRALHGLVAAVSILAFGSIAGCGKGSGSKPAPVVLYQRVNLTSDLVGYIDGAGATSKVVQALVNPWGITSSPTGPFWVADNGSGTTQILDTAGNPRAAAIKIPPVGGASVSSPTGIVYSGGSSFVISNGAASGAADFLFVTEEGAIEGWTPTIPATAVVAVDRSSTPNTIYTGLAIASNSNGTFLYAANFGSGKIDVFNTSFQLVGSTSDPTMAQGYMPFGVQAINGSIYVTYAKPNSTGKGPAPGAGAGYVDVFSTTGSFVRRLISNGPLNAPWGIALAPSAFGTRSGKLLIANFGDGTINAFDPSSGAFAGPLLDGTSASPITIPGLWGIEFGNGGTGGALNTLYFTAGVDNQKDGLFGFIQTVIEK